MSLSHCESESHCAAPFLYIPCLPKSKEASSDAASAATPRPAAVAEEEPPPVQKFEFDVAGKDDDDDDNDEKHEDGEKAAVATPVAPVKSSLKKASCGDGQYAAKGNVKWLDLLGKDLTEVREFNPRESGDLFDDGDGISTCVCVIQ